MRAGWRPSAAENQRSARPRRGAAAARAARRRPRNGVWTAVCDRDPGAPGFRFADRRCIVSTEDEPALERLASALVPRRDHRARPRPLDRAAARIAEKLGIAHPRLRRRTAALCANRVRQREALAAAGVPQPRWQVGLRRRRELELALPVVVKSVDRAGQTQLRLVERRARLEPALEAARAASRGGPGSSRSTCRGRR